MKRYFALVNNEFILPAQSGIQAISLRHPVETIKKIITHFAQDSLYRNSIYLMLSTAVQAFFGFFFWIICARLYSSEQVGLATTLISVMSLIASFSMLGLNVGLVRFLPSSKNKNALINSSLLITSVTAFIFSLIFLLGLHYFSPTLLFVRQNIFYVIGFIIFVIALSNNTIIDSLFLAYRSAKYTFIKNSIFSVMKLILPLILIPMAAYGIFLATGLAYAFVFVLSIFILMKTFKFDIQLKQNFEEIKKISKYSFGNYIAGFIGGLPPMILPIIIINKLGTKESAYFYITMMIANLIFIIPQATTQSFFAEGSCNNEYIKMHIVKALKVISLLLVPLVFITILFGNFILLAFGKNYSSEAFTLLKIFTLSSIFVSINCIFGTFLQLRNRIKELNNVVLFRSILILLLCSLFINYGLVGIGYAWLIGQAALSLYFIISYFKNKNLLITPLNI